MAGEGLEGGEVSGEVSAETGSDFDFEGVSAAIGEDLFGAPEAGSEGGDDLEIDTEADTSADTSEAEKETTTTPAVEALTAPKTWRPEAQAEFAKLPPIVQQEVLKREQEIFQGIEMYKADANFGKELKTVLDPYLPVLEKYNIKPSVQVADMMSAHYTLAFGSPQEKVALLQRVAADYQIDMQSTFGGTAQTTQTVDPQVIALQTELNNVKSVINQQQSAAFEAKKAEITDQVVKFANDPKNIYFDTLANDIAELIKSGGAKTVEEAYDIALYRNPTTRQQEIARLANEKEAALKAEAQEKANKAKKAAAANIRSNSSRGSGTTSLDSIDDTLEKTYAKLTKS